MSAAFGGGNVDIRLKSIPNQRVIIAGIDGFDDAMELPFHSLDLNYTYCPTFDSQVKFKVSNLLDEKKEIRFDDELLRSSTKGTKLSVSYKIEF